MNAIRKPAVQGRFYGSSPETITELISLIDESSRTQLHLPDRATIIGAVLPHAGHVYSGYQTVPFFGLLKARDMVPDTWIIVHPNHRGGGPGIALDAHDAWENALGTIPVDHDLRALLPFDHDSAAQRSEHSCEVLLPYIQYYFPDHPYKILPVCMRDQTYQAASELGKALHSAVAKTGKKVLLLASSDFSHFLSPDKGFAQDQLVVDGIMEKHPETIERLIRKHAISVCGYGPIMTLMTYASEVDRGYQTEIMERGHSGDVSPSNEVVDYISILFYH
jgi:AmmeMemoRadiSam system protein B